MGRSTYRYRQLDEEREKRKRLNPVWRGVGCLSLVAFAVGGYAFGGWFLNANAQTNWIYLPPAAMQPALWIPYGLVPRLVLAFLFTLLGFGVISVAYAILFPIQPGDTDAPALKRRRQKPGTFRSRGR
jgi:hypothetical protein